MRTHVEFRSLAFPAYAHENAEVNPGRWGRRLAEFLQGQLARENIATHLIRPADWGVRVVLRNPGFPLWIGCGNHADLEDGYLCFIEPGRPSIRRWFRRIDTGPAVTRIADALDRILRAHPDIRDVRWWSEGEAPRRPSAG